MVWEGHWKGVWETETCKIALDDVVLCLLKIYLGLCGGGAHAPYPSFGSAPGIDIGLLLISMYRPIGYTVSSYSATKE